MFLLLAHLQAGQVGVLELQAVLLSEVLGHRALHSLSVLQLKGKSVDQQSALLSDSSDCALAACDMDTYVCRLAGRRVTLQTLYFRRMVPQCVTSTLRPAWTWRVSD